MKKFLLIFGSFILFLISFGTLFKLMHWPGAGPLLVIGMSFFAAFFLPLFFINRMIGNRSGLNITTNIFALFSTFLLFMGVLFKIMHWPGAGPMLVFGIFMFVFPTLILYTIQQFKEYDRKFGEFWRLITMGVLVSIFLTFWGTSVSRNILYGYLKVEDASLETNKELADINLFLAEQIKQDADSNAVYGLVVYDIHKQTQELSAFIEEIKTELIRRSEMAGDYLPESHWQLNYLDDYTLSTHFLCGSDGKGRELHEMLHRYKKQLPEELKKLHIDKELVLKMGDMGIQTELNEELMYQFDSWEEGMFSHQTLAASLALLTSVQNEVLIAEFKCLKTIKKSLK